MAAKERLNIQPFLKWPGGKRWFVDKHRRLFHYNYNTYIEPFLGSGAVFFYLQPQNAILNDINPDVVEAYRGIQSNPSFIRKSLAYHHRNHSYDHYYDIREKKYYAALQRASRTIYLNRTCFNGIYRVNLKGEFNVPIGTKTQVILESDDFFATSKLLQNAIILQSDFEKVVDKARKDDFIFADPPYTVRHNFNGFLKYNEKLFSWEDQERLAKSLIRARERGAKVILTNANHTSIKSLYKNSGFTIEATSRFSSISASSANRKQFEELIIYSI